MRLYEITARFQELEALATSEDIPPDVIRDTLDAVEGEWRDKAIAVAAFIRNLEHAADGIARAADDQYKRADRFSKRAAGLRQYLLLNMQSTNIREIDSELFELRVRDNPATVVIDDERQVPEEFWKQDPPPPRHLSRVEIAAALKSGDEVPGCRLERSQRLEIK